MDLRELILCVASIVLAYLLGSISPADILGRLLMGLDIREHGTRNAGMTNVYHVLGLAPAVVTAVFDLSKGLLAMLAASTLDAPDSIVHFAGFAAVASLTEACPLAVDDNLAVPILSAAAMSVPPLF